jgi:hypothetical protein
MDAGYDVPHGSLPVDERSATVLVNDGAFDNWQGEYAVVLAGSGQFRLAGLIVNASGEYPSLETNVTGYRQLVEAARASGFENLPDPTASVAPALTRPASGVIEETLPNRSEGARLILQAARRYASTAHPLAIATGGALTDVADAYLLDPTLASRAVVVASLGQTDGAAAVTGDPNGNRDAWATFIVATRMRLVQVNGYYDQLRDVPAAALAELPQNALGTWLANKQPQILDLIHACDQVSVLAVALPWFASEVTRMRVDPSDTTRLTPDPAGSIWHVAETDSEQAREVWWASLRDR